MRPLLAATLLVLTALAHHAQGPGLGNLTYDASELFQPVSVLHNTNGHGMTTMVGGYLFAVDHGDAATNVAIEFYDVSNPRDVQLAYRHESAQTHLLRDAHALATSASFGGQHVALLTNRGVQFWDVSDPSAIAPVGAVVLPDIPTASYTGLWWLFWQGRYLYVGGTSAGVYVVRVDDVTAPEYVKLVPVGSLGGVVAHYVFAIGNLMVVMVSKQFGLTTLDISDPENPSFLATYQGGRGYSHVVAAGKVFTSGGDGGPVQMVVHDLGHDGSLTYLGMSNGSFSNGAYGSYQDGYFHTGMSDVYAKFDATDFSTVGTATSGIANRDEDFCQVLGNLAFVGDDHAVGSGLYVHDTQPDSVGPSVTWVHPADGAANQALTTRVGVSMSDNVLFPSANDETFLVRELGGDPVPGKIAVQMGIVNFSPDAPLEADTVYEVVVDGIEDLVGNSGPVFRSTFSTGTGGGTTPTQPLTVTGVTAANAKPYGTGSLASNALIYIDRDYTFGPLPSRFEGHAYVRTANDDKFATGTSWLTFDVPAPAEVCVLFDDRATALPAWLDPFEPTGETIGGYDVYSREVPAGTVVLGGNANAPMAGAQSMYSVAVLPSAAPPLAAALELEPAQVGVAASFQAGAVTGSPPFLFSWEFGDGAPPTTYSPDPTASHVYAEKGRYPVVLRVQNAEGTTATAATQIVHGAPTPLAPTASSPIVWAGTHVAKVNPDADTVSALDVLTDTLAWEVGVGDRPRTLALSPAGTLWVACEGDATLHELRVADGATLRVRQLPRASGPSGLVFRPDGQAAYVSLAGGVALRGEPAPAGARLAAAQPGPLRLARVLELDPATGRVRGALALNGKPRGLAVSADSTRLYVARFVSPHPETEGLVWEVDTATFGVAGELRLAYDPGPDTEASGEGVPNYLGAMAIAPDGSSLVVPSKKDNVERGTFLSGQPLTFESRVRTIVSRVDLPAGTEDLAARLDLNDTDMAQAVAFSPLGDLIAVAAQGSNVVHLTETESGNLVGSLPVGAAPQGLVFSPDGSRLYTANFLSRTITVHDTSELVAGVHANSPRLADVATVGAEPLPAEVLEGKRIFYDAADRRMNLDGYLSCATCHLDGGSDGRVWDVTQLGEGLRNTIPLVGRAGLAHGNVHWTANFDEIQDFEHDMRDAFGGAGFLSDPDFATAQAPLGAPKAGLSPELDALASYVASLEEVPESPFRTADGALTPDARAGHQLFLSLGCGSCHPAPSYRDGMRHDVGTVRPSSGLGAGQPLPGVGFDTPTLRGLWDSAPYLHDGRAATLREVLRSASHGGTNTLTRLQRAQLEAFLLQIE